MAEAPAEPRPAVSQLSNVPLESLIEEESRRRISGGRLLLRIRLACDEVASLKEPPPLMSLVSRLAYLPLLFDDVYEHFKHCLPPRMDQPYEIWFDYECAAMSWHYPIGVLCDILLGREVPDPLDLTVHFRGCPSKDVPPFSGLADLQRMVMNGFRQAVYLQQGSAAPFMRLPKQQQVQLWDAVVRSDLQTHASVQKQLLCPTLARCASLAVRLHLCCPEEMALLHPVSALQEEDGAPSSVRHFLMQAMPPLLDAAGELRGDVEVVTHGLRVPLDTPLYWLALHAAYFDQFVHLVVRTSPVVAGEDSSKS